MPKPPRELGCGVSRPRRGEGVSGSLVFSCLLLRAHQEDLRNPAHAAVSALLGDIAAQAVWGQLPRTQAKPCFCCVPSRATCVWRDTGQVDTQPRAKVENSLVPAGQHVSRESPPPLPMGGLVPRRCGRRTLAGGTPWTWATKSGHQGNLGHWLPLPALPAPSAIWSDVSLAGVRLPGWGSPTLALARGAESCYPPGRRQGAASCRGASDHGPCIPTLHANEQTCMIPVHHRYRHPCTHHMHGHTHALHECA